jgi:hypothetical protein
MLNILMAFKSQVFIVAVMAMICPFVKLVESGAAKTPPKQLGYRGYSFGGINSLTSILLHGSVLI